MLYTYPSNRLEQLVEALRVLLQSLPRAPLAADQVLVQHPGMRHWLSMMLAHGSAQRICMNVRYRLPADFFWQLIRCLLGNDAVPERSPYSREILSWRLYQLLAEPRLQGISLLAEPSRYWRDARAAQQDLRRLQLAQQLADLYEQYLLYRPDWIERWQHNPEEHWQALLWSLLVEQKPEHPLRLIRRALHQTKSPAQALPENIFLFGLNTLAPLWLDFLAAISGHTDSDLHLFYLNPSAEHWDDLQSERAHISALLRTEARQRAEWLTDEDNFFQQQASNPLLTSLGMQGQAFVRLLSALAHYDTPLFTHQFATGLLGDVQRDLVQARDARQQPRPLPQAATLMVTAAPTLYREVQGLHDWLLHQLQQDVTLTPKDVLVMCPNIEDYAPHLRAVFAGAGEHFNAEQPRLPCSIADRSLTEDDPTIALFLELLSLPEARFTRSQVVSWLQVPALAARFGLVAADIAKIERWLERAHVHWGLNKQHKSAWLAGEVSDHYSWQQGLSRLILGMAWGDEDAFVQERALLSDVEGQDAALLGTLANLIATLQRLQHEMATERTPSGWQVFLSQQVQLGLLAMGPDFARSQRLIAEALDDLNDYASQAGVGAELVGLAVIRQLLSSRFAGPDRVNRSFLTGQVTACSMVPMRSIPFKIIAVLGLNDGEFPRLRAPLGFDLLAQDAPRLGDRSRRGDDRYLFLEAILSARQSLYLSYQGCDERNNDARPPSILLDELCDYLQRGYGWQPSQQIRRLPLQPHSAANYSGDWPSYEQPWQSAIAAQQPANPSLPVSEHRPLWALADWVHCFTHPPRFFAQQRLGLYLTDRLTEDTDSEPFVLSSLDRYQFQEQWLQRHFAQATTTPIAIERMAASAYPQGLQTEPTLLQWEQAAQSFSAQLKIEGAAAIERQPCQLRLAQTQLDADLPWVGDRLLFWRLAQLRGQDCVHLWLAHLMANSQRPVSSRFWARGQNEQFELLSFKPVPQPLAELERWYNQLLDCLTKPLLLNADFALLLLRERWQEQHFNRHWFGDEYRPGLAQDPYIRHLYHYAPTFSEIEQQLKTLYGPLIDYGELTVQAALDG